jgi:hypothetical protein
VVRCSMDAFDGWLVIGWTVILVVWYWTVGLDGWMVMVHIKLMFLQLYSFNCDVCMIVIILVQCTYIIMYACNYSCYFRGFGFCKQFHWAILCHVLSWFRQ